MSTNVLSRWSAAVAAAFFIAGSAALPAQAVTYNYSGNPFTARLEYPLPSGEYAIGASGDSIAGYISLASALGANLSFFDVAPFIEFFSFSDGRTSWSTTTRGVVSNFIVATDENGSITNWYANIGDTFSNTGEPWTGVGPQIGFIASRYYADFGFTYDEGDVLECTSFSGNICNIIAQEAAWNTSPGTWTKSASSEVPLPATIPLFASGLGVMWFIGWCRKRKNVAALPA